MKGGGVLRNLHGLGIAFLLRNLDHRFERLIDPEIDIAITKYSLYFIKYVLHFCISDSLFRLGYFPPTQVDGSNDCGIGE